MFINLFSDKSLFLHPIIVDILLISSGLLYFVKIYEHILFENSIGLDGFALPYLILEICEASNTMYLDISLILIFNDIIKVFKLLLNVV